MDFRAYIKLEIKPFELLFIYSLCIQFMIQGFTWTLIRNIPTYGIFFAINSYLADRFLTSMNQSAALLLAGGLTGIVSWTAAFPSDTLKPRNSLYVQSLNIECLSVDS